MKTLVLLRHGQSIWNKENLFTGWADVGLTEQGMNEARAAGQILKPEGYGFDLAFTSVLKRAVKTLWLALEEMDQMWIPIQNTWRLNERHYGALQGLNKQETVERYGPEQVHDLAPQLRHAASRTGPDDSALRKTIPAMRVDTRTTAPHRMPEGHGGSRAALLAGNHRPCGAVRQARHHCIAWKQPARTGEISR